MSNIVQHKVRISYEDCPPKIGEVRMEYWDKSLRTKMAFKYLGLCWLAAVLSIFLPIAHFFLVPGFLIAGPFVAYVKWNQQNRLLGGSGQCASCEKALSIEPGAIKWPLEELCDGCWKKNKIEIIEETS